MSVAAREKEGRVSPIYSASAGQPSVSSAEGGGEAYAFRRDMSPRGSGSVGSGVDAVGSGWRGRESPTPPVPLPLERRRLLRMVGTLALDRLQQLDPLDLFKDPVPSGVAGYAEAIPFPIDFSTIRRRSQWDVYGSITDLTLDVQLLCANAMAFNGPGTVYHSAATYVVCCVLVELMFGICLFGERQRWVGSCFRRPRRKPSRGGSGPRSQDYSAE